MGWHELDDIDDTPPLDEADRAVLDEIRDLLVRRGAQGRFGVTLLHSHFELGPEEILVEHVDPQQRTLTTRAVTRAEVEQYGELVPASWRLDAAHGRPVAVVYCHRGSAGVHARAVPEPEEILQRPDVRAALDELAEHAFTALERRAVVADALPNVAAFLTERGITDIDVTKFSVRHTEKDLTPSSSYIPCGPDDRGRCVYVCRTIHGKRECVLKCYGCN